MNEKTLKDYLNTNESAVTLTIKYMSRDIVELANELIEYGTEEQKATYVTGLRNALEILKCGDNGDD